MINEPTYCEIFLTQLSFFFFGKTVYQNYAHRLPLIGDEEVLDFGSGMGTLSYYLAKRLPKGRLTCMDISARWQSACKKTLKKYRNVHFLYGDVRSLALQYAHFDLICCHFVLHDIPDDELLEILPVLIHLLKPKGMLAFREPLKDTKKLGLIQEIIMENGLSKKDSRITDVPLMGNTLESIYIKD